jgi:hypothetical protein
MANGKADNMRRVFISSTTKDLQQYRDVAEEVINAVSTSTGGNRFTLKPVSMDIKTQDGERATALEASQNWVRNECDWVVLIVAWNYGYVPDGEACSVTESEYRAAIAENKKVFVFIPGEKGDNDKAYRVSDRETVDLKDWIDNNPRRPELDTFKAELRKCRLDLFRNLDDFRERLAETLRQAVTEEVFQGIAPTIDQLGLLPPLRDVLDEVLLLARLKRLHDTLHQIRQFGIRTWREQLLASWPDDGDPPLEAQIKYLKGAPGIVKLVERISNVVAELPDGVKKGLPKLNRVVAFSPPAVPECGKLDFTDATDAFATRVQSVFSDCDAQMRESALRLADFYLKLAETTRQALARTKIAEKQAAVVRSELERGLQVHVRLQQVLLNHTRWQLVHDNFEEIDLKMIGAAHADNVTGAGRQRAFLRVSEDFIDSGGKPVDELLAALPDLMKSAPEARAANCETLAKKLKEHLDHLVREPDTEHYDAMRKHFDDLFFQVDLETKAVVESSDAQVRSIETGLLRGSEDASAPAAAIA